MSLDVYLQGPVERRPCECSECGNEHDREFREQLYDANITHNLNKMADAAGIYEVMWRPEEVGITKAAQLIEPLTAGLAKLVDDPARFKQFDSPNGWGLYEHFVPFVREYLDACRRFPGAGVRVSR